MRNLPVIVVQLIHIQGPLKGQIQEFVEDRIAIGRHPTCQLRFPADLAVISRKHAEIVREGNLYKLVDHSTNGTFVNGKRVVEAYLKGGDVLEFSEGGPKVSFLTEMREEAPESGKQPARTSREAVPEPFPVESPVPPRVVPPLPEPPPPPPPRAAVQPTAPAPEPGHAPPPSTAAPPVETPPSVAKVPLAIQYGPILKSYREVPVTIGKHPRCQFVIDHPAIADQHAQIFFSGDRYWVKDLTGQRLVEINRQPVNVQAPLSPEDELALTPRGPVFRFLGMGRLAEVSEPAAETPPSGTKPPPPAGQPPPAPGKEPTGGILSRFRKLID